MKTPRWDLDRVKAIAARPGGLWIQITRAANFFAGGAKQAKDIAIDAIMSLTVKNFVETQKLQWDMADVYGVLLHDGGWYMKLYIDAETQVTVISFHLLERPIKTNGGWVNP